MGPDVATAAADNIVVFDGVTRRYRTPKGDSVALNDVSWSVPRGRVSGVIGHSGAGKSTLIRMVNGLDRPTEGRVLLDGADLSSLRGSSLRAAQKTTGMVFQQFQLLETISVRDNVALPLRLDGVRARDARTRVSEVLDFVGLGAFADRRPAELSGGQKQRVGIARALARNPRLLLCDEATSALDPGTTTQVIELLRRVNREYGTTILVVTHEMDVIKDLCDDVAVMSAGQIVESGPVVDVFVRPRTDVSRTFVSTVVPQEIPKRALAQLGRAGLLRLLLLDEQVALPLVSTLIGRFGVEVNIVHADMTDIQERTVGQMVIQLDGTAERLAAAHEYLAAHVEVVQELFAEGDAR